MSQSFGKGEEVGKKRNGGRVVWYGASFGSGYTRDGECWRGKKANKSGTEKTPKRAHEWQSQPDGMKWTDFKK